MLSIKGVKMSEISDVLIAALEDINTANIPSELREVAFSKAVDLRAGGTPPAGPASRLASPTRSADSTGDALDRIAGRLGLERGAAEDIFHERDGAIELVVGAGKLPTNAATATKEIALLLAAGRQAAGLEEWTPLGAVREMCDQYRRLDGPNFASTIKAMEDVFTFRGTSRRREVRVARPGWEQAAALAQRLAGV